MQRDQSFQDFHADFLRLALNGEVAKTDYKEALTDNITGELRSSLAQRIVDIDMRSSPSSRTNTSSLKETINALKHGRSDGAVWTAPKDPWPSPSPHLDKSEGSSGGTI